MLKRTWTLPGWVSDAGSISSSHYFDSWVLQKCLPNTLIVGVGVTECEVLSRLLSLLVSAGRVWRLAGRPAWCQYHTSSPWHTPAAVRWPKQKTAVTQCRVKLWKGCLWCSDGKTASKKYLSSKVTSMWSAIAFWGDVIRPGIWFTTVTIFVRCCSLEVPVPFEMSLYGSKSWSWSTLAVETKLLTAV